MPRGCIDDGFHSHRKVRMLLSLKGGAAALGLWVCAHSWCNKELTDGFVPDFMLAALGPWRARDGELLVTVGLWVAVTGGFQFHDWTDLNESKRDVLTRRAKDAEKQGHRRVAQRVRKALARSSDQPLSPGDTRSDTPGVSGGVSRAPISELPNYREEKRSPEDVRLQLVPNTAPERPHSSSDFFSESDQSPEPADGELRELFQRTYRELRGDDPPSMAGKKAAGFAARVQATAAERDAPWRSLFVATLRRWLAGERNSRELAVPYACFVAAWDEQAAETLRTAGKTFDRKSELMRRTAEALGRGDVEAYEAVQREMAELMGGVHGAG